MWWIRKLGCPIMRQHLPTTNFCLFIYLFFIVYSKSYCVLKYCQVWMTSKEWMLLSKDGSWKKAYFWVTKITLLSWCKIKTLTSDTKHVWLAWRHYVTWFHHCINISVSDQWSALLWKQEAMAWPLTSLCSRWENTYTWHFTRAQVAWLWFQELHLSY